MNKEEGVRLKVKVTQALASSNIKKSSNKI
jgi:hypothetical protein